jgi:hypothetical protein
MRLALILAFISNSIWLFGQDRCGVDEQYFQAHEEESKRFENWLLSKKQELLSKSYSVNQVNEEIYQIPIVFHIVHQGESIGTGTNLSDDRILEQVTTLNEDFRRLNADTILTPNEFLGVAADTHIEFVLAKRDPEGLPTSGIVRVQGSLSGYTPNSNDERILKAESRWPEDQYLNIYVTNLNTYIGYATFPFVVLSGVDHPNNNAELDGVMIDYQYLGNNPDTDGFESLGRTLTHEIGHFLGLRHVWGDNSNCSADDYCDDTPEQSSSYLKQCPSSEVSSCGTSDMYDNYLNYTNDECMNIFTTCQKNRMRFVIENSPRVNQLISSPALNDPIVVANDIGIRRLISPLTSQCTNEIYPVIEIRNYGTNTIETVSIDFRVDDFLFQIEVIPTQLLPLQTQIINFDPVMLNDDLTTLFSFTVRSVNNQADGNDENDAIAIYVDPYLTDNIPLTLDFEEITSLSTRPDNSYPSQWVLINAPFQVFENTAASISFNATNSLGDLDYLLTPILDISALTSAKLSFDYSYSSPELFNTSDGLIVGISLDCGATYLSDDFILELYGSNLVTSTQDPQGPNDWESIELNITPYIGNEEIRVAFIGQHGGNGQLFLDNIAIESDSLKAVDLGIKSIDNIPVVTCFSSIAPAIQIRNYGYDPIKSFDLTYTYDSIESSKSTEALNLVSGDDFTSVVPISRLKNGVYDFVFTLENPNGEEDESTQNNQLFRRMVVADDVEPVPTRNDFEKESSWIISTPTKDSSIWEEVTLIDNKAIMAGGFNEVELSVEHWFVSPLLDMSEIDSASMIFSYAYKSRGGRTDRLRIYLSENCGNNFNNLLFDASSEDLATEVDNTSYFPTGDSEWQDEFIDLSEYTGSSQIRIAFVFENGNGNNLFIDNIEFYESSNASLLRFEDYHKVFPNPATSFFTIALNLPDRTDLGILLTDMTGKVVRSQTITNALNQNIEIDTSDLEGMFILSLKGNGFESSSSRIFIKK